MTMRLGIVGCGEVVVRGHAPALSIHPGVEVAAITDASPDQALAAAEALGLGPDVVRPDVATLLSEPLDAVLVATPPTTRLEIVRAAAERGVAVVCEKPIATSLADADEIVACADRHGVGIVMCHNYAFFDEFRMARAHVRRGAIGDVRTITFTGLGASPWAGTAHYRPGWRSRRADAGGGRFIDTGVHCLYLMQALGLPKPTAVAADLYFDEGAEGVETRCVARLSDGAVVCVISVGIGHGSAGVDVVGTSGRISIEYPPEAGDLAVPPEAVRLVVDGRTTSIERPATRGMFTAAFYDFVAERVAEGPGEYTHSGAHGRDLLELVLAAYRAGASRGEVCLPVGWDDATYRDGIGALWADLG